MKVLYIHNDYGRPSGEEQAADEIVQLLRDHGHEVKWFRRTSEGYRDSLWGNIIAFFTGIYNPKASRELARMLDEYKPDVVQVQNLYPFISTSIFRPLRKRNVPVVMRCPNYRLFCPQGLCLDPMGQVCERCWNGAHEWNCVSQNCLSNRLKSLAYAVRNWYARTSRNILDGVDVFITQSEFQKRKFEGMGIESNRIGILPGIPPMIGDIEEKEMGDWVTFVGRVSPEKGIYEFIDAARMNPDIPFKVAGNLDEQFRIPEDCPSNVEFVGFKKGAELNRLYTDSRIIVIPSKWYEGFPNVILRGMLLKRPVITTSIGAMQSIIDTGVNGILVTPGCAKELGEAVKKLYYDKKKCIEYGMNGFQKASTVYSKGVIYRTLMEIYDNAIKRVKHYA